MSTYRVHRWSHVVEWGECDAAGIVFYPRFFEWFDWAAWLMFEDALGVPALQIRERFDVAGFPLVATKTRFVNPCMFGEQIEIASQVMEFRRSSFDVAYKLTRGGELAVQTEETRVWVGKDPHVPGQMKSKPIPAEVIERFKAA